MDGTQLKNRTTPWETCIRVRDLPAKLVVQPNAKVQLLCNYDIASTTLHKSQLYICTIVKERLVSLLLHVPILSILAPTSPSSIPGAHCPPPHCSIDDFAVEESGSGGRKGLVGVTCSVIARQRGHFLITHFQVVVSREHII